MYIDVLYKTQAYSKVVYSFRIRAKPGLLSWPPSPMSSALLLSPPLRPSPSVPYSIHQSALSNLTPPHTLSRVYTIAFLLSCIGNNKWKITSTSFRAQSQFACTIAVQLCPAAAVSQYLAVSRYSTYRGHVHQVIRCNPKFIYTPQKNLHLLQPY